MFGIPFSFWDGLFSGANYYFQGVNMLIGNFPCEKEWWVEDAIGEGMIGEAKKKYGLIKGLLTIGFP